MQIRQFNASAPVLSTLQDFAVTVQTGNPADILAHLAQLQNAPMFAGKGWQANLSKLSRVFETRAAVFSVFAMGGNSKLPFIAYSTLPGVTCPGAGECLQFCYSFRAWRYPAAFARQAQNAFLQRFNPEALRVAFRSIVSARPDGFDFRLYVDGDFSSVSDVHFWMNELHAAPMVRAYGYSKSFAMLLAYGLVHPWPQNYMLNLSSGHNASPEMFEAARALPITRGEFRAVSIGRVVKGADHGTVETNRAIRAAVPTEKVFPCPGTCGTCTGAGHACGLPQLRGRVIAIAIH
jgi:hypothetical protein